MRLLVIYRNQVIGHADADAALPAGAAFTSVPTTQDGFQSAIEILHRRELAHMLPGFTPVRATRHRDLPLLKITD